MPQRRLHPVEGVAAQRGDRPHHHRREEGLRHRGRRDDGLRADPRPQPGGRRRERQGRPLPDEEEQDRRDRRLGRHHLPDLARRHAGRHDPADGDLRQPHHRHRCGHPAGARDVAVGARRDLRGADPHRPAPRVDHHRRVGRHRRRVRLRHDELRRRRHHRRVPRPDGPHRGPGRLQGAAQAVQEARRQGPAVHQGRVDRRQRREGQGHRQPREGRRPAGAGGRQGAPGDRVRAADRGLRPRVGRRAAHRPRRDRRRRARPHQPRRGSTPSATSPGS